MIEKNSFVCERCGECCKPIVVLTEEDIRHIETMGYRREDFVDRDHFDPKSKVLKQLNNQCVFLGEYPNGDSKCKIYACRPEVCRKYPFISSNKLEHCKPNTTFEKALREAKELLDKRGFI